MQLTELGFETEEITVRPAKGDKPAQTITVRGIALDDIMKLFRVHGPDLIKLYDNLTKDKAKIENGDSAQIVLQAAEQFPDMVADLIVLATDSPSTKAAHAVAKRLPITVQLKAMEAITRLTLEDHGGVGELVETLLRMFGGVNGLVANLRGTQASLLGSSGGSTASAARSPS